MKNICDWNNCKEIGEYKAPIEKDEFIVRLHIGLEDPKDLIDDLNKNLKKIK